MVVLAHRPRPSCSMSCATRRRFSAEGRDRGCFSSAVYSSIWGVGGWGVCGVEGSRAGGQPPAGQKRSRGQQQGGRAGTGCEPGAQEALKEGVACTGGHDVPQAGPAHLGGRQHGQQRVALLHVPNCSGPSAAAGLRLLTHTQLPSMPAPQLCDAGSEPPPHTTQPQPPPPAAHRAAAAVQAWAAPRRTAPRH